MKHLRGRNYTNVVAYSGKFHAWMALRYVEAETEICAYDVSAYPVVALALYPGDEEQCSHVAPLILMDGRIEDVPYYSGEGGDYLYLGMSDCNIWPVDEVAALFDQTDRNAQLVRNTLGLESK